MSSMTKVRLWGGAMHLTNLELPIETKLHRIGEQLPFWTYEDTGQHAPDGARLFALFPRSRRQRQFLIVSKKLSMRDQRLYVPQAPKVGGQRITRGKAAAARRAKHESMA